MCAEGVLRKGFEDEGLEFGPRTNDLFALHTDRVSLQFFIRWIEHIAVCHDALHGDQDFSPIINEVRDTEGFADPGFFRALQAKPTCFWIHTGLFPEFVMREPGKTFFLHTRSTF